MRFFLLFVLFGSLALCARATLTRNPYEVLGVSRRATEDEIKKQYKRLAKEWHPDKNESPSATEKFMEIQEAYDVLSNAESRQRYDQTGSLNAADEHSYSGGRSHESMEELLRTMMFSHQSGFGGGASAHRALSVFAERRMTARMYQNTILERSYTQPQLVFVYADWCRECIQWVNMWQALQEDLLAIGYGMLTVNRHTDGALADDLRARSLPTLVIIADGRTIHYRGNLFDKRQIIEYCRSVISAAHVTPIEMARGLKSFVDQWETSNKMSVVMFGPKPYPRMRYLLAAMNAHQFARFAYVNVNGVKEWSALKDALNLDESAHTGETVMIFNDLPQNGPIARLSSLTQIGADSLNKLIEDNRHLVLPRLSSQAHFDQLCPVAGDVRQRRNLHLCCVMVVDDMNDYETQRDLTAMRQALHTNLKLHLIDAQRVRFVYTALAHQSAFVYALDKTRHKHASADHDHVHADAVQTDKNGQDMVLVWRVADDRVRYTWMREVWTGVHVNESIANVSERINAVLSGRAQLTEEAALSHLADEHAPSFFRKLSHRTMRVWEAFTFHASKDEILPALSAVGTLAVIVILGYILNYAASKEEVERRHEVERLRRAEKERRKADGVKQQVYDDILRELRAETYFGLVRLSKPGCRTICILVNEENKDKLLRQFRNCVWPWRNNKTLSFAYVMVEKNIGWFKQLLAYTLPINDDDPDTQQFRAFHTKLDGIKPSHTVGTVLALNGWRYYFCMYHPMHAPSMVGYKPRAPKNNAKNFMGFEDEDSTSDSDGEHGVTGVGGAKRRQPGANRAVPATPAEVLSGLPNWFDRLFEGQMRRYYLTEWPEIK